MNNINNNFNNSNDKALELLVNTLKELNFINSELEKIKSDIIKSLSDNDLIILNNILSELDKKQKNFIEKLRLDLLKIDFDNDNSIKKDT